MAYKERHAFLITVIRDKNDVFVDQRRNGCSNDLVNLKVRHAVRVLLNIMNQLAGKILFVNTCHGIQGSDRLTMELRLYILPCYLIWNKVTSMVFFKRYEMVFIK